MCKGFVLGLIVVWLREYKKVKVVGVESKGEGEGVNEVREVGRGRVCRLGRL